MILSRMPSRFPFGLLRAGTFLAGLLLFALPLHADPLKTIVFNRPVSTQQWTLKEINPDLPPDWTGYDYLVLELRASSSQRFELGLQTPGKLISKRIHPFPGVWLRASIPLRSYRQGLGNALDLAATVNQPRNSYWINIEAGGNGPTTNVLGMSFIMRYPVGSPTLEIRSVTLSKTDPGDAILEGKPLIDQFGQYTHAEWPGKAHSEADLQKAWAAEAAALAAAAPLPDRDKYGGFASTQAKATGFFRVEQIKGVWWFIDPDGHYFYSTGINGVRPSSPTHVTGREDDFASIPPPIPIPIPWTAVITGTAGGNSPANAGRQASFYTANVQKRFGTNFMAPWAALTSQRMIAWGLTTASNTINDYLGAGAGKRAYVASIRGLQTGPLVMGMPDVYSDAFQQQVTSSIKRQATPLKDDPWLLGYFIGNEPPWPGRESQFVDLVLQGPPTAIQKHFQAELVKGDTPEKRRDLVLAAFQQYLAVIDSTLKKYDPNHLNFGIRFGGAPPDYVIKLTRNFDVYTLNKYRYEPPADLIANVHKLTGLPILIGEFHTGVPERGMAPGLVLAMNQHERGLAYSYYVEHAAAHPEVIGTHWFEWIDEPVSGRADGENYNIGWVDVTDQPYPELVKAALITHARLLDIHLGKIPPTDRKARTSDVGTADEANRLGQPGIQ
jgi:hypothetical protein